MLIDLTDVLRNEGMKITREIPLEMKCFESGTGSYEIISASPVFLTCANAGDGKARIAGNVSLAFQTSCDRCLEETVTELKLSFERTVSAPVTEDEEAGESELGVDCELDVEAFVHDEIFMNWPAKILCREDCRGICPVCGQNLNRGECGCDTFVPDPRMAVIQDIFNKNKEV